MEYAIEMERLRKTFRDGKLRVEAVKGISLRIRKGEIFGLLGPNGAGKTTTIHMLATLITPTSGTARVLGYDIEEDAEAIRSISGLCMGGTLFLWDMTPREILKYYSFLYDLDSDRRKERIRSLIKDLGITKFQNTQFYKLSTGMKQKVAVAKALLNEPRILFLDEPTAGLDVEVAISIRKYIADLVKEKGTTVILTSHQLYEVEELCREIAVIDEGSIIAHGSIQDIRRRMNFPSVAYFCLERVPDLGFLKGIKGVNDYEVKEGGLFVKLDQGTDAVCRIMDELRRRKIGVIDMEVKKPTLEEVFLRIVRKGGKDA